LRKEYSLFFALFNPVIAEDANRLKSKKLFFTFLKTVFDTGFFARLTRSNSEANS